MDIFNNNKRKIICIDNDDSYAWGFSGTGHLLTVGKEYTLIDTEVHGYHTRVTLEEFPDTQFNSILFEEIDDYEKIIDKWSSIPEEYIVPVEDWKKLGYTDEEAEDLSNASKIYT